jgi:hypothetical protein
MWLRYKLLLVPVVVIFLGGISLLSEKPVKFVNITCSKGLPYPLPQTPKTEFTKSNWSNKASISNPAFLCVITNITINRPSVFTILVKERKIFYSSNYFNDCQGRSPPYFS